MVEGDLWVHAHTDLTDFYRGALTLRQVWVRFSALPAEARIWGELQAVYDQAEAKQKVSDIDDVLSMFGGRDV